MTNRIAPLNALGWTGLRLAPSRPPPHRPRTFHPTGLVRAGLERRETNESDALMTLSGRGSHSLTCGDTWEDPYPERMFSWVLPLSAAHVPKAAKAWIAV
jgi:hypothetical protein